MPKVYTLNNISKKGLRLFDGGYEIIDSPDNADAVLVRSASMHEMELPKSTLCVARAGAGVNNIPLEKYASQGIVVFNTPGANANAVKELVLAGMLMSARDIIGGVQWCRDNASDENIAKDMEKAKKQFAGRELSGKTLGVIGLGAIGVEVANAANKLGMRVLGYDPYISLKNAWMLSRSVQHAKSYDDIYSHADFITLHVPALDSTKGMLNKKAFSIMKKGAVILNYSRNSLVDEEAMKEALENGTVSKYLTDFPTPGVMAMKNVIATPHLGASTDEAEENCAIMAVNQVREFIENGNIVNSVNFPACDMGKKTTACRVSVMHQNIPNMISQVTAVFAAEHNNISNMTNASKGAFAYSMFDLESDVTEDTIRKLSDINGILRVRVI